MWELLRRNVRPDAELVIQPSSVSSAIEADRTLLREVIVNLVINASEALSARGGRIRVSTSHVAREGNRSWWRLEVTDDGTGMDARTVARIFDPFFTTKGDRRGLGLSAVYGIVRRLGGEIAVDSKPGMGTTFHVRLPVIGGAEPKAPGPRATPASALSLRGVSILVADDEPSVRSTIRRLLERRGATVVLASDGAEAAARLRDGSYSLILLDVMMPKLTGYQLLPIARTAQPSARVLLMSGYSDAARGAQGEDEPDTFLEKPFTARQMDAAVDALIDR
jgi:CheY-like chemotaxis protein